MGATRFIATHSGKEDDFAPYKRSLDLIVCTTNDVNMPILGYLSLLRPGGNLILVGAPEKPMPALPAFPFIMCVLSSARMSRKALTDTFS